jgi:hypothetical protein
MIKLSPTHMTKNRAAATRGDRVVMRATALVS